MSEENVVINFEMVKRGENRDLDVPLDMTANEFVTAMNEAYQLGIDVGNIKNCYLQAENPIALLRGDKTLGEFGIRNGSKIYFTR